MSPPATTLPTHTQSRDPGGEAGGIHLVPPSVIQPTPQPKEQCPQPVYRRGTCEHGTTRWVVIPCRRRTCPICGAQRRRRAAARIRDGVNTLGGAERTAYWVGTFKGNPTKTQANRVLQKWVRWIRRDLGVPINYAVVWEVQKRGALHCNVVLSPWRFIPWRDLFASWQRFGGGSHNWIDGYKQSTPNEAVKTGYHLEHYLTKLEQMAQDGRAINYSRDWPKAIKHAAPKLPPGIIWERFRQEANQVQVFLQERQLGFWVQEPTGDWRSRFGEECLCFHRSSGSPPTTDSPPPRRHLVGQPRLPAFPSDPPTPTPLPGF